MLLSILATQEQNNTHSSPKIWIVGKTARRIAVVFICFDFSSVFRYLSGQACLF